MPRRVIKKLSTPGRRRNIESFDPNAIDADGDGLVQDTTRFERPSPLRAAKPSNLSGSMGRVRTEAMKDRDARIVERWKKGDKLKEIAESENISEAAISWAINQARKRGEITEERRSAVPYSVSKPKPIDVPGTPLKVEGVDKEILDDYDSGKSIKEIAEDKNLKTGDVLKTLVKYRLPDEDGKFSIPRKKQGRAIRGAIGKHSGIGSVSEEEERNVVRDFLSREFTVGQIADRNDMARSTVDRILSTTGTYSYIYGKTQPGGPQEGRFQFQDEYPLDPNEILILPQTEKNITTTSIRRRAKPKTTEASANTSARANRMSKLPKLTGDATNPGEVVKTPGTISGSMANDNPRAGRRIKTETEVKKLDGSKYAVKVKYGNMDFEFEVDSSSYQEWEDAYDLWVGWNGNYSMRLASASLMGEPLPKTFGYNGDEEGTHMHDLLGSGEVVNPARSEMFGIQEAIEKSFVGLGYINSGNETNLRPIYRGLTNVTNGDEIMNLGAGEVITLPLSAFTSDKNTAAYYATRGDEDIPNVIIEIMPGAKIANAAGEEYQHQFFSNGEWVTDVTEQVTQGKFKFVRMSTSMIVDKGTNKKIKTITLEQIETFNPYTGKFEKHVGKKPQISGSISSQSAKEHSARLGDIREVVRGLVPSDMQTLRDRAVDSYVNRNPLFIKRLVDINSSDSWENLPDAINPDGTKMSKAQYIAMVNAEQISQAQEYVSRRLNKYAPDFNPWHLQQLQHNAETMYLSSPQMQLLADVYGYPQFAIFRSQEIIDKDSKAKFVSNEEAHKDPKGIASNGTTLMLSGISGVMPYGDDAFIQKGEKIADALQDKKRLLSGHWGLSAEYLLSTFQDDPFQMITSVTDAITDASIQKRGRPWIIDSGHPVSTVRHEASHAIHAGALAKATLDMQSNPTQDVKDAYSLLSIFNKRDWESAALIDRMFAQMMANGAISDYAATGPTEWLAETLSAALSPSKKTRALVGFNHRAILARAFPELYSYLVEGDWP